MQSFLLLLQASKIVGPRGCVPISVLLIRFCVNRHSLAKKFYFPTKPAYQDLDKKSFESKDWDDGGALGCSCGRILI
jgi:hypothetical protein